MTFDADVVIVGFGPGGEIAASLLARAGHRVIAVDKAPAPYGMPRMSTLDGEIARVLQHAADPTAAMEGAIPAETLNMYGVNDVRLPSVDWSHQVCGHPSHYSLHQPNIESALEARIAEFANATVLWGACAKGLVDRGDHVEVTLERTDPAGGLTTETVTAGYVLGFDGAKGFVRDAIGIELDVLHEHTDRWILTDFDAKSPLPDAVFETQIHMLPERPWYAGPNGADRCRTDVKMLDDEELPDQLDHAIGYAFLEDQFGIKRDDVEISRRVAYRFLSQVAKSFRRGRIFIGGDAAHAMCPSMGQGACTAMRDAVNIAWKLDLVLAGRVSETLLDSYETERLPHAIFFVQASMGVWAAAVEEDVQAALARDQFMRSADAPTGLIPGLQTGILSRSGEGELRPGSGVLAPQGRIRTDDGNSLLDDVVGFGGQLIGPVGTKLALGTERCRRLLDVGVHVLEIEDSPAADFQPADDTYSSFFSQHDATAFLARADLYVFGLATPTMDVVTLADDFLAQVHYVERRSADDCVAVASPAK